MSEVQKLPPLERVDGIHYLTDYYSLLGLDRTASAEDINKAFLLKAKEYHPDRFQGLAPEFGAEAERKMRILNKAHSTLAGESTRTIYDGVLSSWDGPISPDGTPVIELDRMFYGAETSPQAAEHARAMNEMGIPQLGFDEASLERAKKIHEALGDEDTAKMLDEQLRKKQTVVNFQEGTFRELLGVPHANTLFPSQNYLEEAENAVATARERIVARNDRTTHFLESGVTYLLTSGDSSDSDTEPNSALSITGHQYNEEEFDENARRILELAQQNEQLMEERLELVRGQYIGDQEIRHDRVVIALEMQDTVHQMAFIRVGTTMMPDLDLSDEELALLFTPENAKTAYENGINTIRISVPEGLPFISVMEQVITDHYSFTEPPEDAE